MADDFEVVISGVGGLFPDSSNIEELSKHLLDNKYLVRHHGNRWTPDGKTNLQPTIGAISDFKNFDYSFFGMSAKVSTWTDPITKLGIARTYEAIVDAGMHPAELRGSDTNVYVATANSEFESVFLTYLDGMSGYTIMGHSRAMFANRISYFYDLRGHSCAYDGSWAWGQLGLKMAADAIRVGNCDAALVVAGNVAWHAELGMALRDLGLVSSDGLCRSFDRDASGGQRSDASVCFLVQRSDRARRWYARVVDSRCDHLGGHAKLDPCIPCPTATARFLSQMYADAGIDSSKVVYLEADGSGFQLMEEAELNAVDVAFASTRTAENPLLVGSVKSNLGHTDGCAGMTSIAKVIVAMETGIIPANLHFKNPNPNIPGLLDGRMKVVTENTAVHLDGDSMMAATTLGLCGTVGHVVLKPNPKAKRIVDGTLELPRLVVLSGRSEEAVEERLKKIKSMPFDPEFIRLTHEVFTADIRNHPYKGYTVCNLADSSSVVVQRAESRPLWLVYSGMGSQWTSMGRSLYGIPVCAETLDRLHAVLEPKGVDLKTIITEDGSNAFDNILKSFVGITAVQIALTNLLTLLGVVAQGMIGHSVGELGCAYADGCLSEEQTILAAYARGRASNEATLVKGMMAAVGLGAEQVRPRLPARVEVACHNSADSCTLSGVAEDVHAFVEELKQEGVFARAVNVADIAYHSSYIAPAAPFLRKYLLEVIPDPKTRSARWVSTSVPASKRDSEAARLCSADYHTNNLLSPVLFEEALPALPDGAVVLEVAPHGLLQAVLKRAVPQSVHLSLAQRGNPDGVHFLLQALGKLYLAGVDLRIANLYPDVEFPVSRGTPSLAPLVSWHHADVRSYLDDKTRTSRELKVYVNSTCPSMKLNGKPLCTVSEWIVLVWECLAKLKNVSKAELPVSFTNIEIADWLELPEDGEITVGVSVAEGSGNFVVGRGDVLEHPLMKGFVAVARPDTAPDSTVNETDPVIPNGDVVDSIKTTTNAKDWLNRNGNQTTKPDQKIRTNGYSRDEKTANSPDVRDDCTVHKKIALSGTVLYADLEAHGMSLSPEFKAVESIHVNCREWAVKMASDTKLKGLLEGLLQTVQLCGIEKDASLGLPYKIVHLDIDPQKMLTGKAMTVHYHLATGILEGEGVRLSGVQLRSCPALFPAEETIQTQDFRFVTYGATNLTTEEEFVAVTAQVIAELRYSRWAETSVRLLELLDEDSQVTGLGCGVQRALRTDAAVQATLETVPASCPNLRAGKEAPSLTLSTAKSFLVGVQVASTLGGLLLLSVPADSGRIPDVGLVTVLETRIGGQQLVLFHKTSPPPPRASVSVLELAATHGPPETVAVAASALQPAVLVWSGEPAAGLHATLRDIASRDYAQHCRTVIVSDPSAPRFSQALPLYRKQLKLGLPVNVLRAGCWGHWRRLPARDPRPSWLQVQGLAAERLEAIGLNPYDRAAPEQRMAFGHLDYVTSKSGGALTMGVAQVTSPSCQSRADPVLRWSVPSGWSQEQAATVPYVFALAYYALGVVARTKSGEVLLVHDAGSAQGQAAVRVGLQFGCRVIATVPDKAQRDLVLQEFPAVSPDDVLDQDLAFRYQVLQRTGGRGANVTWCSLSGELVETSLDSTSKWGRFLIVNQDDMRANKTLGMRVLLNSIQLAGLAVDPLFRATASAREEVLRLVRAGLSAGTVQPLRRAATFAPSRLRAGASTLGRCECAKVVLSSWGPEERRLQSCDRRSGYLIVGGTVHDWLLVAGALAALGAKTITACPCPDSCDAVELVQHRVRVLRHTFGADVHQEALEAWSPQEVDRMVRRVGQGTTLDGVVIISEASSGSTDDAVLPRLVHESLERCGVPDVALVVLNSRPPLYHVSCELSELCLSRRAAGRRAAALAGPLPAVVLLLDRLLDGALGPASVLAGSNKSDASVDGDPRYLKGLEGLPRSPDEVVELGRWLRKADEVRVRQLPSVGVRLDAAREVAPLIAVPPLGLLGRAGREALRRLARRLFMPVLTVELPGSQDRDGVHQMAEDVVEAVQRLRPQGPYNLLGWGYSAPLAQHVARVLEASGHRAVVFLAGLVDGDLASVGEAAREFQQSGGEARLLYHLLGMHDLHAEMLPALGQRQSWSERVRLAVSVLPGDSRDPRDSAHQAEDAEVAVNSVRARLLGLALAPDEGTPCTASTEGRPHQLSVRIVSRLSLESPDLGDIINERASWSRLASVDEMRSVMRSTTDSTRDPTRDSTGSNISDATGPTNAS